MPKDILVGHELQRDQLLNDIESDNVAHAYLFSGPRHLGKMAIARWFATHLMLEGIDADEHNDVRGQIERLVHPDLLVLDQLWMEKTCDDWDAIARTSNVPQQHRAKNKAKTDTISIDDIRALQERLYETGTSKWRCCLIRSVERMQDEAGNAFLKILEEPPQGVVFILTTQSKSSLLPTVVSRARSIAFNRLTLPELRELLEDPDADDSRFILHLAQGAPGTLVKLRDNPDLLREQRLMHSKAVSFWKSVSIREKLSLIEPLKDRGELANQFIMHLSIALREQGADTQPKQVDALMDLIKALKTNANRQLMAQQFVLKVANN